MTSRHALYFWVSMMQSWVGELPFQSSAKLECLRRWHIFAFKEIQRDVHSISALPSAYWHSDYTVIIGVKLHFQAIFVRIIGRDFFLKFIKRAYEVRSNLVLTIFIDSFYMLDWFLIVCTFFLLRVWPSLYCGGLLLASRSFAGCWPLNFQVRLFGGLLTFVGHRRSFEPYLPTFDIEINFCWRWLTFVLLLVPHFQGYLKE